MGYVLPVSILRTERNKGGRGGGEGGEEGHERNGLQQNIVPRNPLSNISSTSLFHFLSVAFFGEHGNLLTARNVQGNISCSFLFPPSLPVIYIYIYIYIYIPLYIYSENNSKRIQFGCHAARWKKIQ